MNDDHETLSRMIADDPMRALRKVLGAVETDEVLRAIASEERHAGAEDHVVDGLLDLAEVVAESLQRKQAAADRPWTCVSCRMPNAGPPAPTCGFPSRHVREDLAPFVAPTLTATSPANAAVMLWELFGARPAVERIEEGPNNTVHVRLRDGKHMDRSKIPPAVGPYPVKVLRADGAPLRLLDIALDDQAHRAAVHGQNQRATAQNRALLAEARRKLVEMGLSDLGAGVEAMTLIRTPWRCRQLRDRQLVDIAFRPGLRSVDAPLAPDDVTPGPGDEFLWPEGSPELDDICGVELLVRRPDEGVVLAAGRAMSVSRLHGSVVLLYVLAIDSEVKT